MVYGVVPPLFGSHPFQAVTEKLDYLKGLGVDALWLSPVNTTLPGDFGYAVTDYFGLRPDYGTGAEFKELVRQAHARGIQVMMDFVSNHTSVEHPYYRDMLAHGKESPYYDFYDRDPAGNVTHYFDWAHLPNLNYDNPKVSEWMTQAFVYWVREYDVDGFRVDAAWGIKERQPRFWCQLASELRAVKPDVYLLAEASAQDSWFVKHGFNAAYDWTPELGHWAWEKAFEDKSQVASRLYAALTSGQTPVNRVARFINNNDTAKRFIDRYGVGTTRVAAALLLTLPGLPIVYTGDEVGAEYEPYQRPPPLSWEDPHALREHYRKLIHLRESLPALASRSWTPLKVQGSGSDSVVAYVRHEDAAPRKAPVLVVLNFGSAAKVRLQLPEQFEALGATGTLSDALTDQRIPVSKHGRQLEVAVPESTALLLTSARTR
ncbi:MAG: alpha-amylase family glycosyl hydrolase [Hyalangium sp.]|uniref:alpha-amylase family glycosyl hydrolase n=1 Tax=Hyalangium sp. TaxID=2028555 RepID=UPI003899D068